MENNNGVKIEVENVEDDMLEGLPPRGEIIKYYQFTRRLIERLCNIGKIKIEEATFAKLDLIIDNLLIEKIQNYEDKEK